MNKTISIDAAVGTIFLLLFGACNNPHNALKLSLSPACEVFRAGEPVSLTASFSTDEGVVCIDRPRLGNFELELRELGSNTLFTRDRDQYWTCGTPYMMFPGILKLPLLPLGGLDVADISGRYVVLSGDKTHDILFEFYTRDDGALIPCRSGDSDRSVHDKEMQGLRSGRYRMRVRFQSESASEFSPPLFWTVYEHPVEASIEFSVE
jgi:hypothetical protein